VLRTGQPIGQRRYAGVRRGQGRFAELEVVQDVDGALAGGLVGQLVDDAGLRLSQPTGRRVYHGTTLATPQRFTEPPAALNAVDQIRAGIVTAGTAPRYATKTRGRVGPPGGGF
jgi:hypothetical protein